MEKVPDQWQSLRKCVTLTFVALKSTWPFRFYSAVHAHLFDIPVIHVNVWMSWISRPSEVSQERCSERDSLQPSGPISKAVKRSSLRRTADWLTVYTKQVWPRLPGRPDLTRFTLSEWSSGVMYSRCAYSFPPNMQLAFLPLNSLGWMESDNPPRLPIPTKPTGS